MRRIADALHVTIDCDCGRTVLLSSIEEHRETCLSAEIDRICMVDGCTFSGRTDDVESHVVHHIQHGNEFLPVGWTGCSVPKTGSLALITPSAFDNIIAMQDDVTAYVLHCNSTTDGGFDVIARATRAVRATVREFDANGRVVATHIAYLRPGRPPTLIARVVARIECSPSYCTPLVQKDENENATSLFKQRGLMCQSLASTIYHRTDRSMFAACLLTVEMARL